MRTLSPPQTTEKTASAVMCVFVLHVRLCVCVCVQPLPVGIILSVLIKYSMYNIYIFHNSVQLSQPWPSLLTIIYNVVN